MKTRKAFEVRSLVIAFVVIAVCLVLFVLDAVADVFYLDIPLLWVDHTSIELITTITLAFTLALIGMQIKQLLGEHREAQDSVRVASGELLAVIYTRFDDWKLTPSERDIALLLIKGLSAQEISVLRETRPGTVKSQSSAIYQKAGVKGRSELAAYFVEDLLGEEISMRNLVAGS